MDSSSPTLTVSEYEERKGCLELIKTLSKEQYEGLFRVMKHHNVSYSENSNGIFFDLSGCSPIQFIEIKKFLDLCKSQQEADTQRTLELDTLRDETVETA